MAHTFASRSHRLNRWAMAAMSAELDLEGLKLTEDEERAAVLLARAKLIERPWIGWENALRYARREVADLRGAV